MSQDPKSLPDDSHFLPAVRREKSALPASYTEVSVSPAYDAAEEPESGGLLEYWRIIRLRKGTVILVASLGAIVGFLVTLPQTPIYQTHTSVEILGLNLDFMNMKQASPVAENGVSIDTSEIQTEIKILQSDSLIERVTTKLRSTPLPTVEPGRTPPWLKFLNLPAQTPSTLALDDLSYAGKNYKPRAAGQTRIIDITVDSPSPDIAAAFANTLTSEFIDQNLEARLKATNHTGQFLSDQLDDVRARLEKSEDRLQQYADQAGLVGAADQKTSISQQRLSETQQALSAARTDRMVKQARLEMAKTSPAEALPDILNDPNLQATQAKITDVKALIAQMQSTLTEEHPKMIAARAQLKEYQDAFNIARDDIQRRITNEYDEAAKREKLLDDEYSVERKDVTGEGERSIRYSITKGEVDSNRQLYDAMLQQLKQASLASALRASNIRVVDPAKAPKHPYKPDVPVSSGLGLLTGLFLGVAFVVMQERADRTIQQPGESVAYLNVPELGIVPSNNPQVRLRLRYAYSKKRSVAASDPADPNVPVLPDRVELVTLQRKPSVVAEAFRATLVSILFSGENGSRPRTIVVTSSNPAEGKSTVVSNLGIALAEVNQRVLLIDADLRKPRLHEIFNLPNDRGLSELLRSKDPIATALEGTIRESGVPDLFVLTSGSRASSATSLLYSSRMPELLQKLRSDFETILIDTPPMLQIPDARVLGRVADRVIMVMRAGKTTRDAALAARKRFSEDGTRVLGTILNDWDPRRSLKGYYGYDNGYYYNGYRSYYGSPNGSHKNGSHKPGA